MRVALALFSKPILHVTLGGSFHKWMEPKSWWKSMHVISDQSGLCTPDYDILTSLPLKTCLSTTVVTILSFTVDLFTWIPEVWFANFSGDYHTFSIRHSHKKNSSFWARSAVLFENPLSQVCLTSGIPGRLREQWKNRNTITVSTCILKWSISIHLKPPVFSHLTSLPRDQWSDFQLLIQMQFLRPGSKVVAFCGMVIPLLDYISFYWMRNGESLYWDILYSRHTMYGESLYWVYKNI